MHPFKLQCMSHCTVYQYVALYSVPIRRTAQCTSMSHCTVYQYVALHSVPVCRTVQCTSMSHCTVYQYVALYSVPVCRTVQCTSTSHCTVYQYVALHTSHVQIQNGLKTFRGLSMEGLFFQRRFTIFSSRLKVSFDIERNLLAVATTLKSDTVKDERKG